MTTDESVWEGAWWSAVAEPADPAARVVRSVLGDRAGREWLAATLAVIEGCGCVSGCPSCVQSPKCGNNNEPLDKAGAAALLRLLLEAAPATGPHAT